MEQRVEKDQPEKALNLTFHASLVIAYQPDPATAQELLIEQLRKNGVDCNQVVIQPFYKTYGGVWFGGYQDIAGYIIKTPTEVIVSYRGTSTAYDQYRDAQYSPQPMKFGEPNNEDLGSHEVHGGFKLDYESSKESRDTVLKSMEITETHPIIFTGHSLGGAVAQIAAADYAARSEAHRDSIKAVHTFGTPRVFATKAVDFYNKTLLLGSKTLHIMASGDPVIGVPPASYGFSHTGTYVMMRTISSFGLSNHLINSYHKIVSKIQELEARCGDFTKEARRDLNDVHKRINLSQYLWQQMYALILIFDPMRSVRFWSDCLDKRHNGSVFSHRPVDFKQRLQKAIGNGVSQDTSQDNVDADELRSSPKKNN